jgi:hypothetical protein
MEKEKKKSAPKLDEAKNKKKEKITTQKTRLSDLQSISYMWV